MKFGGNLSTSVSWASFIIYGLMVTVRSLHVTEG